MTAAIAATKSPAGCSVNVRVASGSPTVGAIGGAPNRARALAFVRREFRSKKKLWRKSYQQKGGIFEKLEGGR